MRRWPGAIVGFGGHASGFAGDYAATTAADGTYTITGIIPGTYPKVFARGAGYDPKCQTVSIAARTQHAELGAAPGLGGAQRRQRGGQLHRRRTTRRSAAARRQLFDQSQGSGWGTTTIGRRRRDRARFVVVRLPVAVNIAELVDQPVRPPAATTRQRVDRRLPGGDVGGRHHLDRGRVAGTSPPTGQRDDHASRWPPAARTGVAVRPVHDAVDARSPRPGRRLPRRRSAAVSSSTRRSSPSTARRAELTRSGDTGRRLRAATGIMRTWPGRSCFLAGRADSSLDDDSTAPPPA